MITLSPWTAETWELWADWEDNYRVNMVDMHYVEECIAQSVMVGNRHRALRFCYRHTDAQRMIEEYGLQREQEIKAEDDACDREAAAERRNEQVLCGPD